MGLLLIISLVRYADPELREVKEFTITRFPWLLLPSKGSYCL